ncbi:ROK family transcriptional regulator [Alkalicoccus daliensis]|uniref:Sugar kinase of the NBD/HSP70 family, may contain an N-terminal HTH domain n=1 Tax=Alkalicoccus daliensis TaxID=745820 RepID=A0A1H0G9T8_9BACI|nr:ROK family transcriptional regulator [Alkalicoccus daliensis]SDO03529.1 Sugar kinase of the NBD/HSP70 family, may contain an N-terminal HTH domain [Alkalicoccus daliensis]
MNITGDQTYIKGMNKNLVLNIIRSKAPLSRADLSQLTGLNKGTVSSLVGELIIENFVYEIGPGESSGGRKPVLLMFKQQAAYAIGLDIGVNYLFGALTDLTGEIIETIHLPSSNRSEEISTKVQEVINQLTVKTPSSPYGIIGIGIGFPGLVNESGTVLFAPNLSGDFSNLKEQLEENYNLPVYIENEANCGAYGEKIKGRGIDTRDLLYISVGGGIGAGVIINNQVFKGSQGYSGEAGHAAMEFKGLPCTCGNQGCWELYASEQAVLRKSKEKFGETLTFEELIVKAEERNEDAVLIFKEIGEYLGHGITNLVNIFNPELVVIGNRMASARQWLEESLNNTVNSTAISFHRENLRVEFSNLNATGTAVGASYFIIEDFFERII